MKTATIEILEEGETIFGSRTNGEYFVRRYEDDIVGFIKHWKTGGRMVITEHIDLV